MASLTFLVRLRGLGRGRIMVEFSDRALGTELATIADVRDTVGWEHSIPASCEPGVVPTQRISERTEVNGVAEQKAGEMLV